MLSAWRHILVCNLLLQLCGVQSSLNSKVTVFTVEDLQRHPLLLLSVCGNVFNVTSAAHLYGTGGSYASLSRKDATRALAKADFGEENLTDDISGFTGDDCRAASKWLQFFKDKKSYEHLGVLNGFFFNKDGEETSGSHRYKQCLITGEEPDAENSKDFVAVDSPECYRVVRESDKFHVVTCNRGYTPRKTYFSAGQTINPDGTYRNINIISCTCLSIAEIGERPDLEVYHKDCDPNGTECAFDNHENDIHH